MSIATIVKEFGPKTALAVAQVTGAEDKAIDRLVYALSTASLCLSVSPSLPIDEDPERWDGLS